MLIALLGAAALFPQAVASAVPAAFAVPAGQSADDGAVLTEAQLQKMLDGSAEEQGKATDYILDHPDAVQPFALIRPITILMQRGDMLQAAFWYYFWQHRSGAWARYGAPDGARALRGSIVETIGRPINEWIGSDPKLMLEVQVRALNFERHTPLYPGRPSAASVEDWADTVARNRELNDPVKLTAYYPHDEDALREYAANRTKNHLYNGPVRNPGKPLREEWR